MLIAFITALIIGFFAGRSIYNKKEVVRYVKSKELTGKVDVSAFKVGKEITKFNIDPINVPLIYWKTDTVVKNNLIAKSIDTTKIIDEFISKKDYSFNVFHNEHGKLDVKQSIQFNELVSFDYSFIPMQKIVTRTNNNMFAPFISAGYNTLNYTFFGGGIFYKDFAVEYNYLYNFSEKLNAHAFGVKYKF